MELLFGVCTLLPHHVYTVRNQNMKSINMLLFCDFCILHFITCNSTFREKITFLKCILIQHGLASLKANLKLQTCTRIKKLYVMWTDKVLLQHTLQVRPKMTEPRVV